MDAFNELRATARDKRDKAIKQAREEYAATLKRIAGLVQDLLGREPSTHRTISSCIDSVIPDDRTFTTVDIIAALEALDPTREWRKRSIDSHVSRLRERGIVRRVKKSQNSQPAVYVIRLALAGVGAGLFISGLWIGKRLNRNVWPPDRE